MTNKPHGNTGASAMRHSHDNPCPITGKPIPGGQIFTDHGRDGVYNACAACHADQRSIGQRLNDLTKSKERSQCS